jgi:hypothetical protein
MRKANHETDSHEHPITRVLFVSVRSFSARVQLDVPFYISDLLPPGGDDWALIVEAVQGRAAALLLNAARLGLVGDAAWRSILDDVAEYARARTYEQFMKIQDRRGASEDGHLVPESLDIWRPGVGVKIDRS